MKDRGISPSVHSYRSCLESTVANQNLERAFVILDEIRPYSTQERLGAEYNSISEFYTEMWVMVIHLLESTMTKCDEKQEESCRQAVQQLKDEVAVLGAAKLDPNFYL